MDFRDLFRNFLGINRRNDSGNYQSDHRREDNCEQHTNHHNRPNFGFGEMLNSVEDMFKEMEQSMKDIDSFFQDFGGFGPLQDDGINFNGDLPRLPPPCQDEKNNDANVRSLVLKEEPEKLPNTTSIIQKSDKVDKDLDDLFSKSVLPFHDIPEPPKEIPSGNNNTVLETPRSGWSSSFERVYSTQTLQNGQWQGKTVRENNDGKQITTYTRNANGEQQETTEFIPKSSASNSENNNTIMHRKDAYNPFQIFERLFKP